MKYLIALLIIITSNSALAGWHTGKLGMIAFSYDGKIISVGQEGFTKTDCTCYPTWPGRYCLDSSRETYDKEYAFLLSAKARNVSVGINIDETTCKIVAIYED